MMIIENLKNEFVKVFDDSSLDIHCFFSPGRVNLIGEHIDYNGGHVFPAALSLGIYGLLRYRDDNIIRLKSLNADNEIIVRIDEAIEFDSREEWGNYPKGVIKYLIKEGYNLKGSDILYYGTLPGAAGLSSSAAMEVLTAYMLLYSEEREPDRVYLAKLCQRVENEFIGVNCGIMDQFSVALGRANNAILLNCDTLEYKYTPVALSDMSLIIINSNKKRELADSKYNERREQCEEALNIIEKYKSIENLCQAELSDIDAYITDPTISKRARHVVTENKRVLEAVLLLQAGNIVKFGKLMYESHKSLKEDYEVTGYELDTIVDEASRLDYCIGCRMTGGGFGGCAVAIVKNEYIEDFKGKIYNIYKQRTNLEADFYVCQISDGVKSFD